jgi:hypothetical protein
MAEDALPSAGSWALAKSMNVTTARVDERASTMPSVQVSTGRRASLQTEL